MIELSTGMNQKTATSDITDGTHVSDKGSLDKFSIRKRVTIIFVISVTLWSLPMVFWSIL
ncbi:hypothetical protein GCM10009096_24600 [Parasphingorhabdus litoris]|uniref:Carbohydrate ABC transporter permease n=1 Tax=Parasphingorhabdus litoris TaxID=394733 RepID=A0ABN1APU8_9SPHN